MGDSSNPDLSLKIEVLHPEGRCNKRLGSGNCIFAVNFCQCPGIKETNDKGMAKRVVCDSSQVTDENKAVLNLTDGVCFYRTKLVH